jgi:hypothetical protein
MTARWRRWSGCVLLLAVGLVSGCNFGKAAYFLSGQQDMEEPRLKKLASDDRDKEVKVAILVHSGMELRPELLDANRLIAEATRKALNDASKYNGEKVKVINSFKVEELLRNTPDWQTMDRAALGERLGADWLITLEISKLSLYQPGSADMLYRGLVNMTIELTDVNHEDESAHKEFTCTYPSEGKGGVIPVEQEMPVDRFKADFFNHLGKLIAWHFAAHPTEDGYKCDD